MLTLKTTRKWNKKISCWFLKIYKRNVQNRIDLSKNIRSKVSQIFWLKSPPRNHPIYSSIKFNIRNYREYGFGVNAAEVEVAILHFSSYFYCLSINLLKLRKQFLFTRWYCIYCRLFNSFRVFRHFISIEEFKKEKKFVLVEIETWEI